MRLFKRRTDCHATPGRRLRVLALSVHIDDRLLLEGLRRRHDWEFRFTCSPELGLQVASQTHYDLILCDRNQPGYPWREVMERLAACSPRSCIVLVSDVSGDYVWGDVLQQGGYDVLVRPISEASVLQAVQAVIRFMSPEKRLGDEALPHRV
jgi:DNA-binding response OmpR family regulator